MKRFKLPPLWRLAMAIATPFFVAVDYFRAFRRLRLMRAELEHTRDQAKSWQRGVDSTLATLAHSRGQLREIQSAYRTLQNEYQRIARANHELGSAAVAAQDQLEAATTDAADMIAAWRIIGEGIEHVTTLPNAVEAATWIVETIKAVNGREAAQ